MTLGEQYGRPWTASAHWGWYVLLTVGTGGLAAFALGLYLSIWIYRKGRSIFPTLCYGFLTLTTLTAYLPWKGHTPTPAWTETIGQGLSYAAGIALLAGPFLLRHEIQNYFKQVEGWDIEIGPFFTLIFSSIYINYCLGPVTLPERNPLTTLDLR